MKNRILYTKAIEGYLLAAEARRLSKNTIKDYLNTFSKFDEFLGEDLPIAEITPGHVERFLAAQEVSKKTILNYHIGLSALWTWAVHEDLVEEHIVQKVRPPKPRKKVIKPFTEDEVKAMLKYVNHTRVYTRPGKRETRHSCPQSERNRAVILLLLDTGMRASELCNIRVFDCDLRGRTVKVFGKGDKERILPFSARTGKAIWRYLATRGEDSGGDYLFITSNDTPLNRNTLRRSLVANGKRAGVRGVTTHRFRHTFAINYLRNGGDPWSLQMMLGHSSMEMVKNYLNIANADLTKNHKMASPVDHWRL